nr:endolysin [Microvirus sp.]
MKINDVLSDDFLTKVANFEGFRSKPYKCPGNHWTVGYGHCLMYDGKSKFNPLTVDEARIILKNDLRIAYRQLSHLLELDRFSVMQIQALVDFVFNLGIGTLQKSSFFHYLKKYNRKYITFKKSYDCYIVNKLKEYDCSNGKHLLGLRLRREFEIRCWLDKPIY